MSSEAIKGRDLQGAAGIRPTTPAPGPALLMASVLGVPTRGRRKDMAMIEIHRNGRPPGDG